MRWMTVEEIESKGIKMAQDQGECTRQIKTASEIYAQLSDTAEHIIKLEVPFCEGDHWMIVYWKPAKCGRILNCSRASSPECCIEAMEKDKAGMYDMEVNV